MKWSLFLNLLIPPWESLQIFLVEVILVSKFRNSEVRITPALKSFYQGNRLIVFHFKSALMAWVTTKTEGWFKKKVLKVILINLKTQIQITKNGSPTQVLYMAVQSKIRRYIFFSLSNILPTDESHFILRNIAWLQWTVNSSHDYR